MMRTLVLLALAGALLWAATSAPDEPADEWNVQHWDSISHPDGFQEVFMVQHASGDVLIEDVMVFVDHEIMVHDWIDRDGDGIVGSGDRVRFVMEAFDFEREIELRTHARTLWHGTFGSGAGTPV